MLRTIVAALALLWSPLAGAQGVIPLALAQQQDVNGRPMAGALLYIYQVGTVAVPQNSFQDFGLTMVNPWPLVADGTGRIPMFYLANGAVHVRLTDSMGVVQFDYPTMEVLGAPPTTTGGGGTIDPTTIAAVGDIKFRITGLTESIAGWVRANGQTIGSALSGATGRANADTQPLYVYLWNNCPNPHCAVSTGRGASAAADFSANKTIVLPDLRGRVLTGLDDMGAAAAGRILNSNVTSGGGDTPTTSGATGGEANHALTTAELAAHSHPITDPGHDHQTFGVLAGVMAGSGSVAGLADMPGTNGLTSTNSTGIIATGNAGSGAAHNTMAPFYLGSFWMKL